MNLNEQQNQQGVLIETPYVPLCTDLIMRYFSEQPNTMYDLDRQYPFGAVDIPMSIFRYGFEECVKSACIFIMHALQTDKQRKILEERGQDDRVAECIYSRDMALVGAVNLLSAETIKNAQSFSDIVKKYHKLLETGEQTLVKRFIEIPVIALNGAVREFSDTLKLPEEITQTLTVGTICNQGFMDGAYNKRSMYKLLFKQMIAMCFNQEILNMDELFEGITTISKFFGDYNILKEHDNQEDVYKFIDNNFSEDKVDEFERLQTAEERRNFLNNNPFGIIGVFLGSFDAPDKVVPIGGYFNPDKNAIASLDELREKGLDVLRISDEEKERRQKQAQEEYTIINDRLGQLLEV